jgi:hypothetical protein
MSRALNYWVQATPDYACVFFLSQGSGAPDPTRSASTAQPHWDYRPFGGHFDIML